jgi:hypothetical protein
LVGLEALLEIVTTANAASFFCGPLQHVGIPIDCFHEPPLAHAAIVEAVCGWRGIAA